jgi:glycosyltransferase involved in cell wall biosynthesis
VAVGRFTIYKGFDLLVKAANRIPEVTLVIVGAGPLRSDIVSLCRKLRVQQNVLMPGMLSDRELHRLIALCDMFVLPSIERTEAFGLVLLEAMYYGKPLITANVPGSGMSFVNIHEQTGLVVPRNDVQGLAEAMKRLSSNLSLRNALGRKARQRFDAEFEISGVANNIDLVYAECLTNNK